MKNIIVRSVAAALALVMFLSLAACGKKNEEPPFLYVTLVSTPLEKQVTDENGRLMLEYSIDIVEFTGGDVGASPAITRAYNDLFVVPSQEYVVQEEEYLREIWNELPEDVPNSWYSQTVELLRSDETVVSVAVDTDSNSAGAAHGNYFSQTVNFSPVTGSIIRLSDLGIEGADPTHDIAVLLAQKFMEEHEDTGYVDGLSGAVEIISECLKNSHQWLLTDKFVYIANPYELASYAEGIIQITLYPEELKGIVDEKWFAEPVPAPQTKVYTGEGDLKKFDTVYIVGDYGYEMNLVWFDCDVRNAFLAEVEYTEEGEFIGTTTLDAFTELKKGDAILLDIMIPEGIPNTALVADIDGRTCTWLIGYNGRDGGISFVEEELQAAG